MLSVISPVAAQTNEPTPIVIEPTPETVTVTVPSDSIEVDTTANDTPPDETANNTLTAALMVIIGVLAVAITVLFVHYSNKLYNAMPPEAAALLQQAQKTALDLMLRFLEQKRTEATTNNVDWDDEIWTSIFDQAKRQRDALDAQRAANAQALDIGHG